MLFGGIIKIKINVFFALFLVLLGAILILSCPAPESAVSNGDDPPQITLEAPTNMATNVSLSGLTLDWTVTGILDSTTTYDIFFDTENPPIQTLVTNISDTQYILQNLNELSYASTYYWKVVAKQDENEITESDVYSFTTGEEIAQEGYVTVSRGGGPVSGATVELITATNIVLATTTTDETGYFSVGAQKGEWKIRSTKSGRATSEATITIDDVAIPDLSLFQFLVVYTQRTLTPPTLSVTGVDSYQSFTGDETSVRVTAIASAQDGNAMTHGQSRFSLAMSLMLKDSTGRYNKVEPLKVVGERATLVYDIDFSTLPYGRIYLEFVAYDNNNNQAVYILPINNDENTIEDTTSMVAPGSNSESVISVSARTISEEEGNYSISDNSNVRVTVRVNTYASTEGIMLYRGTEENNIRYIGSSIQLNNDGDEYIYHDKSPVLGDGKTYYYKVRYYDNLTDGINYSNLSNVITVPIMPRMEVTLVTPIQNRVFDTVSDSIEFTWNVEYSSAIPSDIESSVVRTDTIQGREVTAMNRGSALSSATEINSADINSSTNMSDTVGINDFSIDILGKTLLWTVQSELTYNGGDSLTSVRSTSQPLSINEAQNGMFTFVVKAAE